MSVRTQDIEECIFTRKSPVSIFYRLKLWDVSIENIFFFQIKLNNVKFCVIKITLLSREICKLTNILKYKYENLY